MINAFSCQYDHVLYEGALDSYPVVSSSTCVITSTSTDPALPTYYDIAFFLTVMLFLLSFMPAGYLWSVFKKK